MNKFTILEFVKAIFDDEETAEQAAEIGQAILAARWNDRDAKYDIREWSPDGEKMGKGVTLSREELMALKELLNKMEL